MRGFKTMNDYRTKVIGMIASGAGVVLSVVQKLTHFTFSRKLTDEKSFFLCLFVVVTGLYLMAFSREKFEDERVKRIRAGAVQLIFMLMTATLLAFSLTGIIHEEVVMPGNLLLCALGFYFLLYNIIFFIGLRYDKLWEYNADEIGILENLKKNKKIIIIVQIVCAILLYLVFKLAD